MTRRLFLAALSAIPGVRRLLPRPAVTRQPSRATILVEIRALVDSKALIASGSVDPRVNEPQPFYIATRPCQITNIRCVGSMTDPAITINGTRLMALPVTLERGEMISIHFGEATSNSA
jgi:hypothetical protein